MMMKIEIVLLSCIVVVLQYLPKLLSAATSSIHMISFSSSVSKQVKVHSCMAFVTPSQHSFIRITQQRKTVSPIYEGGEYFLCKKKEEEEQRSN